MTALPTTPNFMDYEAMYLPKNHFIKEESLSTEDYLALFFPFDKLDVIKLVVTATGVINSDVKVARLTVEEGGVLNGQINVTPDSYRPAEE